MQLQQVANISQANLSANQVKLLSRAIDFKEKIDEKKEAKRPPSNWSIGRKSGGITGKMFKTIHSGLLPDFWKASKTSKRRIALIRML